VTRNDPRTGDAFVRDWVEFVGSVGEARHLAGLSRTHLYVWLNDPDRRMSEDSMVKLARAANLPIEALVRRWTPIKDLDIWRWLKTYR